MMKMKTPLLVGIVMIIGALAFMLTFGSLQQEMGLDGSYEVDAVFEDATGLVIRSRVTLSGIPVGQIVSIDLDKNDPSKARVRMRIRDEISLFEGIQHEDAGTFVNGATAMRLQASLLGDYYISVTPGIAGKPIKHGGEIRNVVTESGLSAILDQLESSSNVIFPRLEKISDDIAAITGSVREAIGDDEGTSALVEIRKNVEKMSEEMAALSTEVRTFVNEEIIPEGDRVHTILENVAQTTADLKSTAHDARKHLGNILDNVDGLTAELNTMMGDSTAASSARNDGTISSAIAQADKDLAILEGTLENVQSVTAKVDRGEGTVGRLINDSALVDSVEGVVDDVQSFTSTFSDLQVKIDFRSEYLFMQNALKSYLTVAFYPKPDKYYLFQVVDDPKGKRTTQQRVTTSNDPSKPPVLVEDIVLTEDALKFTAQFAKKWHFLTFRYGIMESTGGWGIDVNLLEDALRFKLDMFEFGQDNWPRLRILAAYEFVRHLYVAAGVDDILNGESREYFVGLGVSFTDDDIKGLLPFLPGL